MKNSFKLLFLVLALALTFMFSAAQNEPLDADTASQVTNNTTFAFDLYQTIAADYPAADNINVLFSPYSISQALAMAYGGAAGDTGTQMAEVMHFDLPQEALHASLSRLTENLTSRTMQLMEGESGQRFTLNVANALWGQQGYAFRQSYLDLLNNAYGAGLELVDFAGDPEAARVRINDWVAEQTEDKIRDIVPPDALSPMTRLVLANAIYFSASWWEAFPEHLTADQPFTLLDGSQVTVPTMSTLDRFMYGDGENYQVIALPYLGYDVAMLVFVPDAGAFETFESELTGDFFTEAVQSMETKRVNISIPRFSYEFSVSLTDALASLGMTDAFNQSQADFSGIYEEGAEPLAISNILHKAFIAVDEEGTEAAAATVMSFEATTAFSDAPIELKIDRPFIYAIYDNVTGSVLFVGRVMDPQGE